MIVKYFHDIFGFKVNFVIFGYFLTRIFTVFGDFQQPELQERSSNTFHFYKVSPLTG